MATTVDERVVAAKFDASDFEKGVDKTIKKLDELKKSLDIKETTKSVKELAEKTEESTDSIGKSLERLTDRFTNFAGMIKQKIISGLAEEVANVFLRMEQAVTGFIKSISSDQVGAGMQKYEQMLSSVRVIMNSGVTESKAYEQLDILKEYSDQTSYSLVQMTDALSKMGAAGVDINVATRSVIGISNACAAAGINATDASRAFYNLSQAYSSGVLKYTDYRSLELLNMTTRDFKTQLLEAAVAAGTLKKVSDGVYQTINTSNKKVVAGKKVTEKNLQDMLRYNFVTTEVMDQLFGGKFFFGEKEFRQYKKRYDTLDEAIEAAKKDYGETAVNAYLAAREARSFTDVVNTLKDVVSTGWAQTFEYLFGRLEQAKKFFTDLAESGIAEAIYKIGEYRNTILSFWSAMDAEGNNAGSKMLTDSILNISDAIGTLFDTILSILPGWDELNNTEEEGTPVLESLGDRMLLLTARIRDVTTDIKNAANEFQKFMKTPIFDDGQGGKMSRIDMLRQIFSKLGTVFTVVARLAGIAFNAFNKLFYALSPIFDGILLFIDKITEPLRAIKQDAQSGGGVFSSIETGISNILNLLEPVAKVLGDILGFLGEVGAFFVGLALDTFASNLTFISDFIDLITELFTGKSAKDLKEGESTLDKLRKDFEGIKTACEDGLKAINDFFTALLSDIRNLLGLTEGEGDDKSTGGIFSGLINFFNTNQFVQDAKAWVDQAIIDVGDFIKDIPNKVKKFGANIYATLKSLFFEEEVVQSGSAKSAEIKRTLTPLGEWLDNLIKEIWKFVQSIPQRIIDGIGTVAGWIDTVFNAILGIETPEQEVKKETDEKASEADKAMLAQFDQFIKEVSEDIKKWFEDLPNNVSKFFSGVGDFVTKVFNAIDEFLFGKKQVDVVQTGSSKKDTKVYTTRIKTGFSKWLDGVIENVKKFIRSIPKYIKEAIKGIGDILSVIINAIFGADQNEKPETAIEKKAKGFIENVNKQSIIDSIVDIGKTILNTIAKIFTGTDDIETNEKWFSDLVAQGIEWIRTKAKAALDWVLEFLVTLPTKIANFFNGESNENAEQNTIGKAILDFGATIGKFILEDLPNAILGVIDTVTTEFDKIWTTLYDKIINPADAAAEGAAEEGKEKVEEAAEGKKPEPSAWEKFVENLGQTIAGIWEKLPTWIAQGIEIAAKKINELIEEATSWLTSFSMGRNITGPMSDAAKDGFKSVVTSVNKEAKEGIEEGTEEGESPLLKAILGIGEAIKNLFITTIPAFISAAWAALGELGEIVWGGITSLFSSDIPPEKQDAAAGEFGEKIKTFFTETLPAKITEAWNELKGFGSGVWEGLVALFTGTEAEGEVQKAVKGFGELIYNFITKDVPGFFTNAWEAINSIFYKDQSEFPKGEELLGTHRIEDELKAESKKFKVPNTEFQKFVDNIKKGLLDALSTIGPAILNGLANAFDFLGKIGKIIIDALSGDKTISDQVEDAYGEEESELKKSLTKIGESLKAFFLDTLPKLIGSAIGWVIAHASEWFGKMFNGMSDAMEEAQKNAQPEEPTKTPDQQAAQIGGVFEFVSSFIKNIMDSFAGIQVNSFITTVGILLAVTILINALKGLFSLADEIEAGADVMKWTAITVGIAVIGGIITSIIDMLNSSDQTKIDNANKIINSFTDLINKLFWMFVIFQGSKIVENVTGMVSTVSQAKHGADTLEGLTGGGGFLGGILAALGIGAVSDVAARALGAGVSTGLAAIYDSFNDMLVTVTEVFDLFSPLVDKLSAMDDQLNKAISAVGKTKDLFVEFYNIFGTIFESVSGRDNSQLSNPTDLGPKGEENAAGQTVSFKGSVEEFTKELQKRIAIFNEAAVFIETISRAMKSIDQIDDIDANYDKIFAFVKDDRFIELFSEIFDKLVTAYVDNSSIGTASTTENNLALERFRLSLSILGSAFEVMGSSIDGLQLKNVIALEKMLDLLHRLSGSFAKADNLTANGFVERFFGDVDMGQIGRQIRSFGYGMQGFYGYIKDIKGFEADKVDETRRKVQGMVTLVQAFGDVAGNVTNFGSDFEALSKLSNVLPGLGVAFSDFFNSINASFVDIDNERLLSVSASIDSLGSILTALGGFQYADAVDRLSEGLWKSLGNETTRNRLAASLRSLFSLVSDAFKNEEMLEEFKESGDLLARAMFAGIQEAFDTDPELRPIITPVLNLSTAKDQLKNELGIGSYIDIDWSTMARQAMGANDHTEQLRIDSNLIYDGILSVKDSIDNMKDSSVTVTDLKSALNMKMLIDGTTLVGAIGDDIDAFIGDKILRLNYGLTVD